MGNSFSDMLAKMGPENPRRANTDNADMSFGKRGGEGMKSKANAVLEAVNRASMLSPTMETAQSVTDLMNQSDAEYKKEWARRQKMHIKLVFRS